MINCSCIGRANAAPMPNAKGNQVSFLLRDEQKQKNGFVERQIKCFSTDLEMIKALVKEIDTNDTLFIVGELVQVSNEWLVKITSFEIVKKAAKVEIKQNEGQF